MYKLHICKWNGFYNLILHLENIQLENLLIRWESLSPSMVYRKLHGIAEDTC